jgi:predicted GIY-YIG superfamily endonuclease
MDLPDDLPAGQYVVYALIDPADQLVYYVGQTRNPTKRLAEHLRVGAGEGAKTAWLRSLREREQQPIIQILETVIGLETALKQEQKWIQSFIEKGMPLVNVEAQRESLQHRRSTQAIMPLREEIILFCGYPLTRVFLPNDQAAIVLRHLTDALQLSRPGQLQRLQRDPLLRRSLVYVLIKTKRGSHVVLALMEEAIFSWITSIQSGTFSPEKRQLLLAFQREAAKLTQPTPTIATPQTASCLLRQDRRKRKADSKREWHESRDGLTEGQACQPGSAHGGGIARF